MDHYQTLISLYIRLDEQLRTELRGVTLQALRGSFTLQRKAATLAQIEAKLREMQVALSVADNEALTAWWADQQAVTRGQLAHLGNLHGVALGADNPATWAGVNHRAINAIAADLSGRRAAFLGLVQHADGRPGGILRQVDDYLRTIAGEELPASLVGESTYRVGMLVRERGVKALADGRELQVLAEGLDRCLGVTYANGTQHSLHAYGQMVARTGVMRARSEAAMGEMQSYGVHAYQVSTHGTICYLCKAHEGVVYALDAIGEQQGYPRAPMPPPYHPACGHIALPWFGVPSEGPPKAPPDIVYASDREKYAWMRENHPELLQASRQGFGSEAEWKRAKRVLHKGKGVELSELRGKRWRYRGIEQRRIQATADMLTNHKQPYKQAMRGVTDAYMQTPDYAKQRAKTGFYSPSAQRKILAGTIAEQVQRPVGTLVGKAKGGYGDILAKRTGGTREVRVVPTVIEHYRNKHADQFDIDRAEQLLRRSLTDPPLVIQGKKAKTSVIVTPFDNDHLLIVPIKSLPGENWVETIYIDREKKFWNRKWVKETEILYRRQ